MRVMKKGLIGCVFELSGKRVVWNYLLLWVVWGGFGLVLKGWFECDFGICLVVVDCVV